MTVHYILETILKSNLRDNGVRIGRELIYSIWSTASATRGRDTTTTFNRFEKKSITLINASENVAWKLIKYYYTHDNNNYYYTKSDLRNVHKYAHPGGGGPMGMTFEDSDFKIKTREPEKQRETWRNLWKIFYFGYNNFVFFIFLTFIYKTNNLLLNIYSGRRLLNSRLIDSFAY